MRVAICFYGILGSKNGKDGKGETILPEESYKYYKKHIFDKNDVDVFIHSWSHEYKKEILDVYNPKSSKIEPQKKFPYSDNLSNPIRTFKDIKYYLSEKIKEFLDPSLRKKNTLYKYRACSRWYSSKQVLDLKKEYELKNNFIYDMVMVTRFDVAFFKDVLFKNYDSSKFWASHWNDLPREENNYCLKFNNNYINTGFLDFWFFSNSKNMDKFGELYDHIKEYAISPHFSSKSHVLSFLSINDIQYTLYRWQDFEMIRSKFYNVLPPHGGHSLLDLIKKRFFNT